MDLDNLNKGDNMKNKISIILFVLILNVLLVSCGNDNLPNKPVSAPESSIAPNAEVSSRTPSIPKDNADSSIQPATQNKGELPANSKSPGEGEQQQGLFEKGYYDYAGTINQDFKICMSIYPDGKNLVGTYFYESMRKEIKIKGKVEANQIILNEFDENENNTGIFKGTIKTVDGFEGTWSSLDGKKQYPFKVALNSIINGAEYGHRYSGAGFDDDKEIEKFVENLQSYIKNDDKEKVSSVVAYPISVKIDGKKFEIKNKDEFIKNYDSIFNPDFRNTMSNAFTKYMFANWKGLMFGGNTYNMWINNVMEANKLETLITAINN